MRALLIQCILKGAPGRHFEEKCAVASYDFVLVPVNIRGGLRAGDFFPVALQASASADKTGIVKKQ
jgi:hypothetical protein